MKSSHVLSPDAYEKRRITVTSVHPLAGGGEGEANYKHLKIMFFCTPNSILPHKREESVCFAELNQ
jgi:hypothetical protein